MLCVVDVLCFFLCVLLIPMAIPLVSSYGEYPFLITYKIF